MKLQEYPTKDSSGNGILQEYFRILHKYFTKGCNGNGVLQDTSGILQDTSGILQDTSGMPKKYFRNNMEYFGILQNTLEY